MEAAGEWVAFLLLNRGRGIPIQEVARERHGLCSFGAAGSSGARLERFAGRCNPCRNAANHIFQTYVYMGFPLVHLFARAALATAVYSIKVKMAGNRPCQKCWCFDP